MREIESRFYSTVLVKLSECSSALANTLTAALGDFTPETSSKAAARFLTQRNHGIINVCFLSYQIWG